MADELTPKEKEIALAWLNEKWVTDKGCPICTSNQWRIGDALVAPMNSTPGGGVMIGGPTYPQLMLICTNCGHTHYFNAVVMGLVKSKPKDEPPPGDS